MLKCNGLSFSIKERELIKDISLSFSPGKLYGILGPNGSGKTTFLKCLSAIWKPTTGMVTWQGEDLHRKKRIEISKILSFVPQNISLPFDFSVEDIVAMGRYAHQGDLNSAKTKQIVEETLQIVDALHLMGRPISQISNGERQRVYMARALATESPVLLLDEPTVYLDIRHQIDIWKLLQKLVLKGKIVVFTHHDLLTVQHHCQEVILFHQGKLLNTGQYHEVMTPETLLKVFKIQCDEICPFNSKLFT